MGDPAERYVIRTARTVLRPVSIENVDELHRLWIHPDVRRYFWDDEVITPERAEAAVREAAEGLGRHGFGLWVVDGKDDGRTLFGFCGLRHLDHEPEVEILYGISPPHWGRGLATEVAMAMLRYGFGRVGLARILGIADAANAPSRRVLEKIGMTFEEYVVHQGRREARYSIRPQDLNRREPGG